LICDPVTLPVFVITASVKDGHVTDIEPALKRIAYARTRIFMPAHRQAQRRACCPLEQASLAEKRLSKPMRCMSGDR
jgi:hypothetical protein